MPRIIFAALPIALLAAILSNSAWADSVRTGKLKRACLSEAQIAAQLKRRGLRPVQKFRRRGNTLTVLAERGRASRRSGARLVVDACSGKILQVKKALLPTVPGKLKLKTVCKSKAEIVAQFDAAGYYHIQVFGPMKLTTAPQGYTGQVYTIRAWTKTPPKCPWDFVVKCSDGAILQQTPDLC